jgi:uracil-DNA glycosylase
MSTEQEVLDSLNLHPMGDTPAYPGENFDIALARLAEGVAGVTPLDLSLGAAADRPASAEEIRGAVVVLLGATAARSVLVEDLPFRRLFINPGAHDITIKCAGTDGVVVPAATPETAGALDLYCDGIQVRRWLAPPGATAPGALPPGGTVGQVLKKISEDDGDAEWAEDLVGGGGAGTFNPGDVPDARPEEPDAFDDEFDGSSLNVAWDWINGTNTAGVTATVRESAVFMKAPATGFFANKWKVLGKALPAGDFDLRAHLCVVGLQAQFNMAGIMLYESASKKLIDICRIERDPIGYIETRYATTIEANADATPFSARYHQMNVYLRARRAGTLLYLDYSPDGRAYFNAYSTETAARFTAAPDTFGIFLDPYNNQGLDCNIYFNWVRRYA